MSQINCHRNVEKLISETVYFATHICTPHFGQRKNRINNPLILGSFCQQRFNKSECKVINAPHTNLA